MAGTEPFSEDSSPPNPEAQTVKLKMEDKMAHKKNDNANSKIVKLYILYKYHRFKT